MSSILKALKKVEDDKAVRRPDELKIDAEILRSDNTPRFAPSTVILISFLLLAGGSGLTYMYMTRDKPSEHTDLESPALISGLKKQPTASSVTVIKTDPLPPAVVIVPSERQKTSTAEAKKPQKPPIIPSGKISATAASKSKTSEPTTVPKSAEQIISTLPVTSAATAPKPVPSIRVNGIAFQDGSADGVAMINGVPLSKGAMIEGAKIEEIHKNKVKFSYNGEKFEIPLGQANR